MRRLTLSLFLFVSSFVYAEWPDDGSYTSWSTAFTIQTQASKIDGVLDWYWLDLDDLPSEFWSAVQSDGDDIRFTQDDGETSINHRLIFINTGSQKGLVAVAQPHGSSGASTNITSRLYVGNAGASASSSSPFPDTLEGLWMFQEQPTSNTAVLDYSGNARHSTTIAGSMTSGDLITGGPHSGLHCVNFDGNDRITVPSTIYDDAESANAYTWFGWVKLSDDDADRGIFGSTGSQLHLRYDFIVDGFSVTQRNSANSGSFVAAEHTAVGTSSWHFVCAVFDGSTLKLFVNGSEVDSVSATSLRSATLSFHLGYDNTSYWRGNLAEMGLYSTALSVDQINSMRLSATDATFWVIDAFEGEPPSSGFSKSRGFFFGF